MRLWPVGVWIAGLLTFVPWATWHLLFRAPREQYAILLVGIGFWVFGYWGVVGPLLLAWRIRALFRSLERAHAEGRLAEALRSGEAREIAIDLLASENGIPRFLAARILDFWRRGRDSNPR